MGTTMVAGRNAKRIWELVTGWGCWGRSLERLFKKKFFRFPIIWADFSFHLACPSSPTNIDTLGSFWFTVLHYCWITAVVFSDVCSDSLCYTTAESVVFSDTGSDSLCYVHCCWITSVVFSDTCSDSPCYATAESSQWCSVMLVLIHHATLLLNQWCSAIPVLIHCATLLLNHLSGVQWYLFWYTVLCYCWITSVVYSDVCSDSLCYTAAESPQWCSAIPILIHHATLLLNHLSGVQWCLFWFTMLHYCWISGVQWYRFWFTVLCYCWIISVTVVFSNVCSDSLCYATAESPQ